MKDKITKKNIIFILFSFTLLLFNILYVRYKLNPSKLRTTVIIILTLLQLITSVVIYKLSKKETKIENIFLFIIIPIGFLYLILIPFGHTPDETSHMARAYEVSEGHLMSKLKNNKDGGREIPIEIYDELIPKKTEKYKNIKLNLKSSGKKRFEAFTNTSLYSFVNYLPQAVGIFIARNINLSITFMAYFGRIFNFISWVIFIYFGIKKIPILKEMVLFISLLPITIQEAISLSPDAIVYSVSILYISYIVKLIYEKRKRQELLTKKEYIILLLLSSIISLCKIVYLPVCFLAILLPKKLFKTNKHRIISIGIIIATSLFLNLSWLKISSIYLKAGYESTKQIQFILSHPFLYVQILFNTIINNGDFYLSTLFGQKLEQLDLNLISFIVPINLIIFVLLCVNKPKKINITIFEKTVYFIIFLIIFLLIFTSLYIQWNTTANSIIDGIQGRYFLPTILLVPLMLIRKNDNKYKFNNEYLYMIMISESIIALITIFARHI